MSVKKREGLELLVQKDLGRAIGESPNDGDLAPLDSTFRVDNLSNSEGIC